VGFDSCGECGGGAVNWSNGSYQNGWCDCDGVGEYDECGICGGNEGDPNNCCPGNGMWECPDEPGAPCYRGPEENPIQYYCTDPGDEGVWDGCDWCDCPPPDCAGESNGDSVEDECGVCNGSGPPGTTCNCDGVPTTGYCDCNGSILDVCGVCGGGGIGDVNGDGDINIFDLVQIAYYILDLSIPDYECAADYNQDG
jgi:hypothetical protein